MPPPGAPTPLERAAGVAVLQGHFVPGAGCEALRGQWATGARDDSAAWRAALASGHRVQGGGAGVLVDCLDAELPVVRAVQIDLEGATLKPRGNARGFLRTPPPASASSAVLQGATQGSGVLTLQSSSGFLAGQWLRLELNDVLRHDPFSYPPGWTKISAVHGNTVELGTPLQVTYGAGDVRAFAYRAGLLLERFVCRNGIFANASSTPTTGTPGRHCASAALSGWW